MHLPRLLRVLALAVPIAAALLLIGARQRMLPELCPAGAFSSVPQPDHPSPRAGYLLFAHAHNDYLHDRPLFDALRQGFHSVEADIYLRGNDLLVSHLPFFFKGSLRALYLDPLQALVKQRGSVLGDGEPFHLWIDIKDGDPRLVGVLRRQLAAYPMITRFGEHSRSTGPVIVVLTGNEDAKRAFVSGPAPRLAVRDDDRYSPQDPTSDGRWAYYSLDYSDYFRWDGQGTPDADFLRRLHCLTAVAHAKGRRVRLFGAPETPAFWKAAVAAGLDFLGTDDLPGLAAVLTQLASLRRPPKLASRAQAPWPNAPGLNPFVR